MALGAIQDKTNLERILEEEEEEEEEGRGGGDPSWSSENVVFPIKDHWY